MATIKSHTDIEQSRKLEKILPLESADMYYFDDNGEEPKFKVRNGITYYYDSEDFLSCWSLAALLSVLPRFIEFKGDKYYLRFMKEYVEYANDEVSITGRCLHTTGNDNLVDACVDMIEKLNELNLL